MKNVIIFVLSPFSNSNREPNEFTDSTGDFHVKTEQTNESCLKYLMWKLDKEKRKLDKAFAFVTPNHISDGTFERFEKLFASVPIGHIKLPEGTVQSAMATIPKMHDELIKYQEQNKGETIRVSVDITGGFRHASMMMLPMTQLLKYSGFEIGDILYANLSVTPKTIEDASDLINFTSLVGGAEEFVNFGSVTQIRNYFAGSDVSIRLRTLLSSMKNLSDTLSICGSYEATKDALGGLGFAIEIYENSIKKDKKMDAQELYFSKLLPKIKEEYENILPISDNEITPIGVIRWCLDKGLLQQAVTFYAEWLPPFLLRTRRIYVSNKEIVAECRKAGKMWSHWSIHLFRNYVPNHILQIELKNKNFHSYSDLVPLFQTGDFKKVVNLIKGSNQKFDEFLEYAGEFCELHKSDFAVRHITDLDENDLIRRLMEWTTPSNSTLENYVYKRITSGSGVESIIVKALGMLPKDKVVYYFNNTEEAPNDELAPNTDRAGCRRSVFEYLLENKFITTTMKKNKMLDFIERYEMIVGELRNHFAHANAGCDLIEGREDVVDAIRESLDFIS